MTGLTTLLSHNPHVRSFSTATVAGCDIIAVNMPSTHLMQIPFDAFAISNAHPQYLSLSNVSGYTRFDFMPRQSCISDLFASKGNSQSPSILCVKADPSIPTHINHTQTATISALQVAAAHRFSSIAFVHPFMIQDGETPEHQFGTMVTGIMTALLFNGEHRFKEIVIGVDNDDDIKWFDKAIERAGHLTRERLQAAHRERLRMQYQAEFQAFITERTKKDGRPPHLIMPYTVRSDRPMIVWPGLSGPSVPIDVANLKKTKGGYVRLISNAVLDRAMKMVPEFLRTVRSREYIPPFHYSRVSLVRPEDPDALSYLTPMRCVVSFVPSTDGSAHFLAAEIALMDLPIEKVDEPYKLASLTLERCMPRLTVELLRENGSRVPDSIYRRIVENLGPPQLPKLNRDEVERYLIYGVLHECAETIWYSLPASLREKWKSLYPLNGDRKDDRVFYRNLLRVHFEMRDGEDEADYFAKETFADKLALHWHENPPSVLRNDGTLPSDEMKTFFMEVIARLLFRRARYGSALIKFE